MNNNTFETLLDIAFQEKERQLRLRLNRTGCAIALVLMPLGFVLDYSAYPSFRGEFAVTRIVCEAFLAIIAAGLLIRQTKYFGAFWAAGLGIVPMVTMCYMIFRADGLRSNYFVGLIILMVAVCLLLTSLWEAVAFSCVVVIAYGVTCCLHGAALSELCGVNVVFLAMIGTVCSVVSGLNLRGRREQFRLSFMIDQKNAELAELDRRKSQFFANVSHELRTPLTLILGPVESLLQQRPPFSETIGDQLVLIRRNGLRLLKLIDDLLDLVRIEHSAIQYERRSLNLPNVLSSVVEAMQPLAQQKSVQLSFDWKGTEASVCGDEIRLERAFQNLVHNAIKYTPNGGTVQVRGSSTNSAAIVEIVDTGVGIAEKDLPRIFERYFQPNDSRIRTSQGLGIGLHLTKDVVQSHGGEISVANNAVAGCTFTVKLPCDTMMVSQAVATTSAINVDRRTACESAIHKDACVERKGFPKALIVDDEPDVQTFFRFVLGEKYDVFAVPDAETGLRVVQDRPIDIVVLDLMLSGMNGLEACPLFRNLRSNADMKIIMLTAKVDEGTKIAALRAGADDFLTKPFTGVELVTRIDKLIESAVAQRELRLKNRELEVTLDKLKEAESQLVQSEKMNSLGTLAAGLLHEINNPLNYSLLAVNLASRSSTPPELVKEQLNCAIEGLQRINTIISDLRTFAYPETANQLNPFNLGKAIENALRFTAYEAKEIAISTDVAVEHRVIGSLSQISQVLVNLIGNAVDSVKNVADVRGPDIRISAMEEGAKAVVQVQDNGKGIPEALRNRLFEPFFTTKGDGHHIGLGLTICSTILRRHGTELFMENETNGGATMTFFLPLEKCEE